MLPLAFYTVYFRFSPPKTPLIFQDKAFPAALTEAKGVQPSSEGATELFAPSPAIGPLESAADLS